MPLNFFKNKEDDTNGAMISLSFNSKDKCLFLTGKKQKRIDFEEKAFENSLPVIFRLNLGEIGELVLALSNKEEMVVERIANDGIYKKLHLYWSEKGAIFKFYYESGGKRLIFFVGFKRNEIPILLKYVDFTLEHIFSAIYSLDKKMATENSPEVKVTHVRKKTPKEKTIELRESKPDDGDVSLETQPTNVNQEATDNQLIDEWPEESTGVYSEQDKDF